MRGVYNDKSITTNNTTMNEKSIFSILETIENPYLITLIILIISLAVIYKEAIIKNVIGKFFKKKKPVQKIQDLLLHDVFATLERATHEVKIMKFYTNKKYDKVKSKMCYDFTKSKSRTCAMHMKNLARYPKMETMSNAELKNFIIDAQNKMHKDYVENTRNLWLAKGILEEDVDHVIHLFETFRYDVVSSFEHRIESIFGSSFHTTNFDKTLAVFNMWAMGIDLLPRDMQITFEGLNGKFKNIRY